MHASRKFKNRWPCQKFRWSGDAKVDTTDMDMTLFASVGGAVGSGSFGAAIFRAIEWQISHVLREIKLSVTYYAF